MRESFAVRALLIEDDPHDKEIILRSLQKMEGSVVEVHWVSSVTEAEVFTRVHSPDIALVDLNLEDSFGLQTLDVVRAMIPHVPLVILTGHDLDVSSVDALAAGAQEYINKDLINPGTLRRALMHAMERHRLQSHCMRTDRLASVGQLGSGIAHEVNSPLSQIMAELEAIQGEELSAFARNALERALERAHDIKHTVEALYSFSNAKTGTLDVIEPAEVVQLAVRLSDNARRHVARLHLSLGEMRPVRTDPGRTSQAVLDMLKTSIRAAPRDERKELTNVWLETGTHPDGRVFVMVEDDGPPARPAELLRMLEPFGVTTGERAPFQGLGLAAANELAKEVGGSLDVRPSPRGGVCFELSFPSVEVPRSLPTAVPVSSPIAPLTKAPTRLRILWVDDDERLLRAFVRKLKRNYDVETCHSGSAALELLAEDADFDVICCDLMMPGMSGGRLSELIGRRYPGLATRIIFVTGGAFTGPEREFLDRTANPVLMKPFQWDELDAVIGRVGGDRAA